MGYKTSSYKPFTSPSGYRGGWQSSTASGAVTLTKQSAQKQKIDPGGDNRDVTLPTVAKDMDGYWFEICNAADDVENLVVKDDGGNTIGTVNQNETGEFYVDDAGDWQLHKISTTAAS